VTAGLLQAIKDNLKRSYTIVWPVAAGSGTWSFDAYVTSFKPVAGMDTPRQAQIGLRIAGPITLSDA
jgi:hypothetical protein